MSEISVPSVFDSLLLETKSGFDAIIELVSAGNTRLRHTQERVTELEERVRQLEELAKKVPPQPPLVPLPPQDPNVSS